MGQRPFFIVSAPRSGSTLLRLILDSHPKLAVPPPGWLFDLVYPYLYSYGDLNNEESLLELAEDLLQTPTVSKWPIRTTARELVALSKAQTGSITYGSPGNGSVPHLATELLKNKTGGDFTHAPYKGGGPAVTDLVAGHIKMMMASPIEVSQHVAAGRLRYLAASTRKRSASVPNVPTLEELGVPDYEVIAWFGIVAPSGTPKDVGSVGTTFVVG